MPHPLHSRSIGLAALAASAVNLLASAAMLFFLAPATAAGGSPEARMYYIVTHKGEVQAGWAVWIAAALSLVYFFYTLSRRFPAPWDGPARFAALLAVLGAASDTLADVICLGVIPDIASAWTTATDISMRNSLARDFLIWDRFSVLCTGGLGNTFYGLSGCILTWVMWRTREATALIRVLALPLWGSTFLMSWGSFALDVRLLPLAVGMTMSFFVVWSFLVGVFYLDSGGE